LDPEFDTRHKERIQELTRRKKVEEWIQEEAGVPSEVAKGGRSLKVFVDFLVWVNTHFCTDENDTWIIGGYEECYKTLSFTGAPHLCSNEWNTNLAYLKFDAQPHEVFALFRDIADDGIIPHQRFVELESIGSFVFDALREGIAKAKEQQQTRKMGFVPEKPRSVTKKAQELAAYGGFWDKFQGAISSKSEYSSFIAEQEKASKARTSQHHRATTVGIEQGDQPRKTVTGVTAEEGPESRGRRESMPM